MKHINSILDQLDRAELRARLGVGDTAISNAVAIGKFPSSWYSVVSALCGESKIDCPIEAFKMREPIGCESTSAT